MTLEVKGNLNIIAFTFEKCSERLFSGNLSSSFNIILYLEINLSEKRVGREIYIHSVYLKLNTFSLRLQKLHLKTSL